MSEHIDKKVNETVTVIRTENTNKTEVIDIPGSSDASLDSMENKLHLMDIYLAEWRHRDELFWKQIFLYFFATLVVMILPFIHPWELSLPSQVPQYLFPAVGCVMALVFFLVCQGYLLRLRCARMAYEELIQALPNYRRPSVQDIQAGCWGNLMSKSMAGLITGVMFIALLLIGATLIFCTIRV